LTTVRVAGGRRSVKYSSRITLRRLTERNTPDMASQGIITITSSSAQMIGAAAA
jgi:hypothetical protein